MLGELLVPCSRCGALAPDGLSGCHALFAEILALEYTDPAYGAVNHLTVDAHALQHPEDHGVKNNAFHLARLCWILEYGGDPRIGPTPRWLQAPFDGTPVLPALAPPDSRGEVTVVDVAAGADARRPRCTRNSLGPIGLGRVARAPDMGALLDRRSSSIGHTVTNNRQVPVFLYASGGKEDLSWTTLGHSPASSPV